MKLKTYIFILAAIMSTSCAKWLDVQPSDTASEGKLFEVAAGYRVALNGVYKLASSPSLYGKEMTWGLMSSFGRDYLFDYNYIEPSHEYYIISERYQYSDKKALPLLDNIWRASYKCIVNCNNLIGKIRNEDPKIFSMGALEKNLITGEAMAMRAMLHFDLLRLYAPALIKDDGKSYIPYYDQDGLSTGQSRLTVKQVLAKVVEDLKKARDLVAPYDTLDVDRKYMLSNGLRFDTKIASGISQLDIFLVSRGYRMNYTAISAILARVYNYMGEHKLAYDEALMVSGWSSSYNGFPYTLFTFTRDSEVEKNTKTYQDLIFTLQDPRLYENYLPYIDKTGGENSCAFALANDLVALFTDVLDYRGKKLTRSDIRNKKIPLKNVKTVVNGNSEARIADMLPIIKLSEMYYIQAEYFASVGKFPEAAAAMDRVRVGRNCTTGAIKIADKESFEKELINEARREFFSEGQTYYYYKKLGIKPKSTMKDNEFSFPIPLDEDVHN